MDALLIVGLVALVLPLLLIGVLALLAFAGLRRSGATPSRLADTDLLAGARGADPASDVTDTRVQQAGGRTDGARSA